ncbi:LacI family DNA-binding transcriptional regulator [Sphingomonas sp. DT-51]|uniref:LacI family DNA-binding transcriptional regulator n=1 Tax=Sphingomonas sp. DT-51 TaxID=3396165 RepID=UPI003F1E3A7A
MTMERRAERGVTMRAVAARAGVSPMTVSNVINGAGRAGAATVAAVRAAIDELGYVPNLSARQLARARATTVGLIYSGARTPFLDAILTGSLRATNAHGLQLLLREEQRLTRDAAEEAARALVRGGADALLLIPPFAELLSEGGVAGALGVPAAAIATGGTLPGTATVRIDNRAAMRALTQRLIARGHRRIGFVAGPSNHSDSYGRVDGYREALVAAAIPLDAALEFEGRFDHGSGCAAAETLLGLAAPPSAIMCSNDDMAAGVIGAAHRRGLRLPRDLAVTGFDDTTMASLISPALTTVRQPIQQMAYRAAEMLIRAGRRGGVAAAEDELVDYELIERESTAV